MITLKRIRPLGLFIFFGLVIAAVKPVSALVNLQPDPNGWVQTVPSGIYQDMRRADGANMSPSLFSWISAGNNSAAQTVDVNYGQASVQLKYNAAGVVGWSPNQVIENQFLITSVSGSGPSGNSLGQGQFAGVTQSPLNINFTPGENTPGKYDHTSDNFTFSPGGNNGFTREGEYTINVVTKSINKFRRSNGELVYRCVPTGGDVPTFTSWNQCPTTGWSFKIFVDVGPEPQYDNQSELRTGAQSPTGGNVEVGRTYKLYPRVRNFGPQSTFGIHTLGAQNLNPEYIANAGIGDLTPASKRFSVFGIPKDYRQGINECSATNSNPRDCWLWFFQDVDANSNVDSNFTFRVKNTATVGEQACFRSFVRRRSTATSYQIGNQLCYTITNPPVCPAGTDFAGQNKSTLADNDGDGIGDCDRPRMKPYLKVYGNDVAVGSAFGPSCNIRDEDATIEAHARSIVVGADTKWAGASGQFGLLALGQIDGFSSSGLRNPPTTVPPNPRVGLTFGNFDGSSQVSDFGGEGGQRFCMQDFFAKADVVYGSSINDTTNVINTALGGNPNIADGTRRAIYIRGNAFINGTGIRFANAGGWSTLAQIPSLYVIVEGNIYVEKDVTELDGVYIAQPQVINGVMTPNTGRILTCTNVVGISFNAIVDCDKTLTINGAFIAHQVHFQRTKGDVATADETETASTNPTKAAEIFKFSPETYLAPLHPTLTTSQPYKKYDYITSLPPIL